MPGTRSARRVISTAMGIAAIFDPTGTAVYRGMRPVVPPGPYQPGGTTPQDCQARPGNQDPFESAMSTIMAAHHDAVGRANDESGVTLVA
jgi:hypothetical protein